MENTREFDRPAGLPLISCDEAVCQDLTVALRREWLETNGLGGFASSTIAGLNTRRYHGLLVAAKRPPLGRQVLLSKLEETLIVDGRRFELSANQIGETVHPQGYRFLKEFRLDPFPVYCYEAGGVEVEKSVFMVHGKNTTVVQYRLSRSDAHIELRPLVAGRDFHTLKLRNNSLVPHVDVEADLAVIKPYENASRLYLAHNAQAIELTGHWAAGFAYEREHDRGYDWKEDLFNPLVLRFCGNATIIASTRRCDVADADRLRRVEVERRRRIVAQSPSEDGFLRTLVAAADRFVVARGRHKSIIAGYPWFGDWGRDTMIAFRGLTLVTGRFEIARGILQTFAKSANQGMIPNRFPDYGDEPEYNTVDGTLWFFEAVRAFLDYTEEYRFVQGHVYEVLADMVAWHQRGTRYNIHVDSDGLLCAGEPGLQLTWMDAKANGSVVTPRQGKPVEVQALWYNALKFMEDLAGRFDDSSRQQLFSTMAALARQNFERLFWNEKAGCLYDLIDGTSRDDRIRPNQILAVSLPFSMLSPERALSVVSTVERELRTPYGLRTLAPGDPNYCGRYEGDIDCRDRAYHQGTVWPWLMGPFLTAYIRVHGGDPESREQASRWLDAFRRYIWNAGLGQIPEVFDGDAPQRPDGCIAQAWSVGELLRAVAEDVLAIPPSQRLRQAVDAAGAT